MHKIECDQYHFKSRLFLRFTMREWEYDMHYVLKKCNNESKYMNAQWDKNDRYQ